MLLFWETDKQVLVTPPSFLKIFISFFKIYFLYQAKKICHCEANGSVSTQILKKSLAELLDFGKRAEQEEVQGTLSAISIAHSCYMRKGENHSMIYLSMQLCLKRNFKSAFWMWFLLNQSSLLKKLCVNIHENL